MSDTVFVTGRTGFIGRALLRRLEREGRAIFAPPRSQLDLLDAKATAAAVDVASPHCAFHLASPGVFARPDDLSLISREVDIARNLIEALPSGARLIHAGSMAEYGGSGRHREDDVCHPRNAYAEAKYRAGQMLLEMAARYGVDVIVARIFGAYGPGEGPRRLLPAAIAALENHEPIALSDGEQMRDFVHVDDVAHAMTLLASSPLPAPRIVNVGTGRAIRVSDVLLRLAADMAVPETLLRFGTIDRSPHDQDVLEADVGRLASTIGWIPPERLLAGPSIPALMRDGLGDGE